MAFKIAHPANQERGSRAAILLAGATLLFAAAISNSASAATYYVRADGTTWSKESSTGCASAGTAMSVNAFRNQSYAAGDRIVFCHEGGVYRLTLDLPADGTPAAPITYDGRGTAVFSGSDIVSGWTHSGGNVFTASFYTQPQQVFINGVFGNRKSGTSQLKSNRDWYFNGNTLYLYSSSGDPDTVYTSPGVEASARQWGIIFSGRSHIAISGVIAKQTNQDGIGAWNPGSNVTIRNCVGEWNWKNGIAMNGNVTYQNIIIEDNVTRQNGLGGILFLGPGRDSIIRRNRCYDNADAQSNPVQYEWEHDWTFGIKLFDGTSHQEGILVESNHCYNNGRFMPGDYQGRGVGIWVDAVPGNPANPIIIRHNAVHDNAGNGIFIEISSNTITQGNVLHNNATNSGGTNQYAPGNIVIDSRNNFESNNNLIYNNTSYGGRKGIKVVTYEQWNCRVDNNIIRNNIAVGASEHNLYAVYGGDNDGQYGWGNIFENNNFGQESPGFIGWSWTNHGTYASWQNHYGRPTYSVPGDPEFKGTSWNNLTLEPTSPCRNTGMNLGTEFAQVLSELSTWPSGIITANQNSYDSGWEVGAYAFTGGQTESIFADSLESGNLSAWVIVKN